MQEEEEDHWLRGSEGESPVTPRISVILTVYSDHRKDPSDCFAGGKPSCIAKSKHQRWVFFCTSLVCSHQKSVPSVRQGEGM